MKKILSLAVLVTLFPAAQGMQPYFFDRNAADQNFQRARQARVQPAVEEHEEPVIDWRDLDIYHACNDVAGDNVSERDIAYMFHDNFYTDLQSAQVVWARYFTQKLGLSENIAGYEDSEIDLLLYFLSNVERVSQGNDQNEIGNLNAILGSFSTEIQNILAVWDVAQGQNLNRNIQQVPSVKEVITDLCHLSGVTYEEISRVHNDQLAALTYDIIGDEEVGDNI